MKKRMSIYSYEKKQWVSTDNFGSGYRKVSYIPLSLKELEKFQKEAQKGLEKWSFIHESGFISTLDIIRCLCQKADLRNTWDSLLRGNRLYVDQKLKNSGYYSYKDRSIYKDGSVFWKIDEIEHCYPDIRKQIQSFIEKYTPKEERWNGEIISLYYGYSGERLYVEAVRRKKVEYEKQMRKIEETADIGWGCFSRNPLPLVSDGCFQRHRYPHGAPYPVIHCLRNQENLKSKFKMRINCT